MIEALEEGDHPSILHSDAFFCKKQGFLLHIDANSACIY